MNEKIQINIYKGLPMVLDKVKAVALAAVIGKKSSWINNKLCHYVMGGYSQQFLEQDITLLNNGLQVLGEEISQHMVQYVDNRDEVIRQVKELSKYICMPYLYREILKEKDTWYKPRMLARVPGRKVCVFKEDDILRINMAAMQIANELKSIELTL